MPLVVGAGALAGDRERLARAGAGPELAVVGPAGESSGERPASDAGEKVALSKPGKVICSDVDDGSFIHFSCRNQARGHEVAKPLRGVGVELVVVVGRN